MGEQRGTGEEEPEPHLESREGFPSKGLTSKQEIIARQGEG